MKKFFSRFKLNAPVTLGFVAICGIALLLDRLTGDSSTAHVFCTYRRRYQGDYGTVAAGRAVTEKKE